MPEFIVVRHNPNIWPNVEAKSVQAADISQAIYASGWMANEVVSIRLNLNAEPAPRP